MLSTGDGESLPITQLGRRLIAGNAQKFTLQPLYLGFVAAFVSFLNEPCGLAQFTEAFCWLAKSGKSVGKT